MFVYEPCFQLVESANIVPLNEITSEKDVLLLLKLSSRDTGESPFWVFVLNWVELFHLFIMGTLPDSYVYFVVIIMCFWQWTRNVTYNNVYVKKATL